MILLKQAIIAIVIIGAALYAAFRPWTKHAPSGRSPSQPRPVAARPPWAAGRTPTVSSECWGSSRSRRAGGVLMSSPCRVTTSPETMRLGCSCNCSAPSDSARLHAA